MDRGRLGRAGALFVLGLMVLASGGAGLTSRAAFTPSPAFGAQTTPVTETVELPALQILKGMSNYLAHAASFTFTAMTTADEPATTGQWLEFHERNDVTVTRQNKLYMRYQGDVVNGRLWYDGQRLTLLDVPTKLYARVAAPTTIDGMLMVLTDTYHESVPVAPLLYADPYARLIQGVKSGFVVGAESLGGIHVYHLAFTEAQADWQIWIQDSRQPLPMRLTVTYTDVPRMSSQRVSSTFENWNVDARVSDAQYVFTAPAGAQQVPLRPR